MPKNAGLVDKDVDEWKDKIDSFKEIGDNLGVLVEIEKRDSQINQRLISFLNRQVENEMNHIKLNHFKPFKNKE